MTEKELRKMSRRQLLELLLEAAKEVESLRNENERLSKELQDRTLRAARAGSIAEEAMRLNGVFEAAQAAADQYLESIQRIAAEQLRNADPDEKGENPAKEPGDKPMEALPPEKKAETV